MNALRPSTSGGGYSGRETDSVLANDLGIGPMSASPCQAIEAQTRFRPSSAAARCCSAQERFRRARAGRPARARSSIGCDPGALQRPCQACHLPVHAWPPIDDRPIRPQTAAHPRRGKPLPFAPARITSSPPGKLLASPWKFSRHGGSGAQVSELLPHIASIADELCFVRSMHGSNSRHGGALLELHTGSDTFTRPAMGSWINYGLGTENEICQASSPSTQAVATAARVRVAAFLPARFSGTRIGSNDGGSMKIPFIENPLGDPERQRREIELLGAFNRDHLARHGADSELESRIAS